MTAIPIGAPSGGMTWQRQGRPVPRPGVRFVPRPGEVYQRTTEVTHGTARGGADPDHRQPASALIVVAEDERGWATPMAGALRQHGVLARVQTRPEAARVMLAEQRYRLVILGSAPTVDPGSRPSRGSCAGTRRPPA